MPQERPEAEPVRGLVWLVDGFNLLHAGLLSREERQGEWWRDPFRIRVAERVRRVASAVEAEATWVVFDGPHGVASDALSEIESDSLHVAFAESADDWLLARVRGDDRDAAARFAVVTADRPLASRLRHRGARVVGPRDYLDHARD